MLMGITVGVLVKWIPFPEAMRLFLVNNIFHLGGQIFLNLVKLLVIPIVFVSLVYGTASLGNLKKLGRIGVKTIVLYLLTTAIAVFMAMALASAFQVGQGLSLAKPTHFVVQEPPSFIDILINIVPKNPFKALAEG